MVRKGAFEFKPKAQWDNRSEAVKKLIRSMLTVDVARRPYAADLLASDWLNNNAAVQPAPLSKDFVQQLKAFQTHSRLKKIALAVVAQGLPDSRVQKLQDTFRALDKDGDGTLSPAEVQAGLLEEGLHLPEDLDAMLRSVDCNGSGFLDYTEFVAATIDKKTYIERDVCWAAFRKFDLDGDGKITNAELHKVLTDHGLRTVLGKDTIENIIREVDANGDGCIDFDEWLAMMQGPQQKRRRLMGKQPAGS